MHLLDSDILTLLFHEHERVMGRLSAVERSEVFIPIVAKLEIIRGRIEAVIKAADGPELLRAQDGLVASEEFLAGFAVVLLDETSAVHFDRLRANKRLKKIGRPDLLIACIALAHNATLVTRNTKDFAIISGLKVENWAD